MHEMLGKGLVMREKILIVDDAKINRELLKDMLHDDYEILEADNGQTGLEIVKDEGTTITAILLDIMMPVMDGFQFMEQLHNMKIMDKIPVLVISGDNTVQNEKKCFDYGVSDFIGRPFNAILVKRRIQNMVSHFTYKNRLEEKVEEQTAVLREANKALKEQTERLEKRNQDIMDMLGAIVECRNLESGEHVKRVKGYTRILANEFGERYPEYHLDKHTIDMIVASSALHDLGKIAIPDNILMKPGKLTKEEFECMKTHTIRGYEIFETIDGDWEPVSKQITLDIIRHHHERYDGKGYPDGLRGDDIPISAQLVSLADVYDALISERCYKSAYTKEEAYNMITGGQCGVFSPKIMDVFKSVRDKFEEFASNPIVE